MYFSISRDLVCRALQREPTLCLCSYALVSATIGKTTMSLSARGLLLSVFSCAILLLNSGSLSGANFSRKLYCLSLKHICIMFFIIHVLF